jgi:hypothetical protein
MSEIKYLNWNDSERIYNIEKKTIISILGNVIQAKGIDYVITEFIENKKSKINSINS